MIVLISPENDVNDEIKILNQLFEVGLEFYHLRKPKKTYDEYCSYLDKIDPIYHNRIVVHRFHDLVNRYNLKGIHFKEEQRKEHIHNPGEYFKNLNMFGKTISSSFHEVEDLVSCDFEFDYHFLSPVFESISKKGYKGRGFNVSHIDKFIIGMGGIDEQKIPKVLELGFKGIGVLGGVWNTPDPLQSFISLKRKYTSVRF
jgi:thiamine-phosphate pyrophosphorylase